MIRKFIIGVFLILLTVVLIQHSVLITKASDLILKISKNAYKIERRVTALELKNGTIEIYVEKYYDHDNGQDAYRVVDVKEIKNESFHSDGGG